LQFLALDTKIYKTILQFLLYELRQSYTLKDEPKLQVYENKIPRKLFGPKDDIESELVRVLRNYIHTYIM